NPEYAGSPYHAVGGPVGVAFPPSRNPLCEAFNAGIAALGYERCDDFNVPEPHGYGYRQATIWNGLRVSTASAYLRPAMRRPNLVVRTRTHARRVLLDGRRAVGVEVQTGHEIRRLRAHAEVIVSAGAFHSPHLLLHSGIGPAAELQAAGIEPLHDLPAVGGNLQDHPATLVVMDTDDPTSYGLSLRALPRALANLAEYAFRRTGPLASNLFETNAYIKTGPAADRPDMQVVFQPARRNARPLPVPIAHGFAISVVCLYPESRGTVRASGPDPLAPPLIDPKLLESDADV